MNAALKFSIAPVASRGPFEIKVPASIANLGPGFDTLAVAVQLYLRLCVRMIPGRGKLEFRFVGQDLCGENYIERAFQFLARKDSNPCHRCPSRCIAKFPCGPDWAAVRLLR